MKRRNFIEGTAALGSAALAGGVLSQLAACSRQPVPRPNIVYILAEDPGETTDLAAGHARLCAELSGLMRTARTSSELFPFGDQEG